VEAPKVFVSYIHENPQHRDDVLAFARFLRNNGVDPVLDMWSDEHRHDWYTWAIQEMTAAAYIIVVASPTYRLVGDGMGPSDLHRGVRSEAALLRDELHGQRGEWTRKVLPVLLPGHDISEIPRFLSPYSVSRYVVTEYTVPGAEDLLRVILQNPAHVPPPLLPAPDLPPRPAPVAGDPVWCAEMSGVGHGDAPVEVHLLPGEELVPCGLEDLRRALSGVAASVRQDEPGELAWAETAGGGIAVFPTGQRTAWCTPASSADLAAALAERIELLARLDLPSPNAWVPVARAGSARAALPRVAAGGIDPAALAGMLATQLIPDRPAAPRAESGVTNSVTGNVTGNVIQSHTITGDINLS